MTAPRRPASGASAPVYGAPHGHDHANPRSREHAHAQAHAHDHAHDRARDHTAHGPANQRAQNHDHDTATPRRAGNGPGRLLLIPTPLQQPEESGTWLLEADRAQVAALAHFYVETPKTARRWLGVLSLERPMQELSLHVLPDRAGKGKQAAPEARDPAQWLAPLLAGEDAGLLSDAGCPGVADPGGQLVAAAHAQGIEVIPLVGPSSLLLGLMASGLNGQRFAFQGYLPSQPEERGRAIVQLAQRSRSQRETQLLIETPYRNQAMAEALITHLPGDARLCIATDLTGPVQSVRTLPVSQWRKKLPELPPKRPAVFLFLA